MRASRRTFACVAILALVIALVVITMRGQGSGRTAEAVDGARLPIDDAGMQAHDAPADTPANNRLAAWAAMARELSRDSSDAICVQIANDATEFAQTEQRPGAAPQDPEARNDWIIAELGRMQRAAASGRDPETLLAALLLRAPEARNTDDASTQTLLLELGTRAANSASPVLAWHALRACAEAGLSCPFAHLEHDLLAIQRDNAEAWALVATLRYQRGDVAGALAAMQGAASASTSTWHWPGTIVLAERAIATHTSIPYPDSASIALGAGASSTPSSVTSPATMCKLESTANRAWAEACLAFGTLRQQHNETELGKGLAFTLRRQALTALGETERAVEVQAEYERYSAERRAGGQELMVAGAGLQAALIDTGRAKLHAYLGSVRQSGESAARREFLRQEAPALLERAGLLGQEGARECVAELFLEARAVGETRQAVLEHRLQAGDELHISLRDRNRGTTLTRRVGADGKLTLPRGLSLPAAGMTTEQFQRELAAAVSNGGPPPEALVIPISRRAREELRSEFDNARKETVESHEERR